MWMSRSGLSASQFVDRCLPQWRIAIVIMLPARQHTVPNMPLRMQPRLYIVNLVVSHVESTMGGGTPVETGG